MGCVGARIGCRGTAPSRYRWPARPAGGPPDQRKGFGFRRFQRCGGTEFRHFARRCPIAGFLRRSRWSPRSRLRSPPSATTTGANATNHASDSGRPAESLRPVCAVPVLPATCRSPICASCPVPSSTTRCMMPVSVDAVRADDTGRPISSDSGVATVRPDALSILSTRRGAISTPSFAIAAGDHRHLQRRGEQAGLADRDARRRRPCGRGRRSGPARR